MSRRGEGRVKSSKRRQQNNVRNQMAQLTVSYDELLREHKILKQIQVDRFKLNGRWTRRGMGLSFSQI